MAMRVCNKKKDARSLKKKRRREIYPVKLLRKKVYDNQRDCQKKKK